MTDDGFFDESQPTDTRGDPAGAGLAGGVAAGMTMGTNLNADAVNRMNDGAREMLDSVKGGGFRITERGVEPLLKAVRNARDRFGSLQLSVEVLSQEPPLGSSPYARQVASHVRQSADGPDGIIPVMSSLLETLRTLEETLLRASGQYRDAEANAAAPWAQD
ncbi:hypothetical protein [Saccharomonospora iraqiensis]|uniref:hypothetical protein n=1 Tax=Saccharomonospora iraqiensis TaxID=52698 RepID=UPI00047A618E|nr:hypothetical protein [Saccharomonospora iraqiensis]